MKRTSRFAMTGILVALFLLAACGGGGGGGTNSGPTPSAPETFNLISPANNDTTTTQPTLKWNLASNASSYTVQIDLATNPSFTTLVYTRAGITTTSDVVSGITLTAGDSYIWRVLAVNAVGSTPSSANIFTVNDSGAVIWVVTSNPTGTGAEAFGMAIDASNLYAVGYDTASNDDEWRIEKLNRSNGAFTAGFGSGGVVTNNPSSSYDDIYGVVTNGSALYAVGFDSAGTSGNEQWRIEKRSLSTGALDNSFGAGGVVLSANTGTNVGAFNEAFAAASDVSSLYVVGYDDDASGNEEWRIEKRSLSNGALNAGFDGDGIVTSATGTGLNEAMAIAIDTPPQYMYVVGYDTHTTAGNEQWRIEKRDLDTGAPEPAFGLSSSGTVTSDPSPGDDEATAVAVDSPGGFMYVAGFDSFQGNTNTEWRIEKRSLSDGSLYTGTTPSFGTGGVVISKTGSGYEAPTSIVIDTAAGYMYVAGYDFNSFSSSLEWRIEKRSLSDGSLDASFGTNGVVMVAPHPGSDAVPWSLGLDAASIYIAGYDTGPSGVSEWRIEKRKK